MPETFKVPLMFSGTKSSTRSPLIDAIQLHSFKVSSRGPSQQLSGPRVIVLLPTILHCDSTTSTLQLTHQSSCIANVYDMEGSLPHTPLPKNCSFRVAVSFKLINHTYPEDFLPDVPATEPVFFLSSCKPPDNMYNREIAKL
jgi:hypothetical protein